MYMCILLVNHSQSTYRLRREGGIKEERIKGRGNQSKRRSRGSRKQEIKVRGYQGKDNHWKKGPREGG